MSQSPSLPNGVVTIGSIDAFNNLVNKFRENLIIVEFFADWCNPCKQFKPIYEELQKEYYTKGVIFTRVNSEEFPEVMQQFNIMGVPSMLFIKNKVGKQRTTGAMSRGQFIQIVNSLLS
jgi:thiol-disulfide isomerase/thioredoxin